MTSPIARFLHAAGVEACFGAPLDGVTVTPAPPRVAELLATAVERVLGTRAAVHLGDGTVTARPGTTGATTVPVGGPYPDLPTVDRWIEPESAALELLQRATNPLVLAGADVVLEQAVPGLHAVAAAGNLGVVNTFTAKGVFDWRSRHHFATAGLQARDFALCGLADADLIVATGINVDDVPFAEWWLAPTVDVPPQALDRLAELWTRPHAELAYPELRSLLFPVTQAGWERASSPLAPTRVTRAYAVALSSGGMLAADPGVAGYWAGRTFTTTQPGSALLPSSADAHGFAVACALVARMARPQRRVLAVVDGPVHDEVWAVLEWGRAIGVEVGVEIWTDAGDELDADAHGERLGAIVGPSGGTAMLATDPTQLAEMVELAGPVVAWNPVMALKESER